MSFLLQRWFLVHLWTLSGLGLSMGGLLAMLEGRTEWAARLLFFPILIDFTDGTWARRTRVRERIPSVSGETLDMITDVVSLTFAPLVFFWHQDLFLPGLGAPLCILAIMTCSLKYGMKENVLRQGYSTGSTPIFFSLFLFYLLELPPIWPTLYTAVLIGLCLLPIRYPITSHVTTHWKPGWKSLTNYYTALAFLPILIFMQDVWKPLIWGFLGVVIFQLYAYPMLLRFEIVVKPGFDRAG